MTCIPAPRRPRACARIGHARGEIRPPLTPACSGEGADCARSAPALAPRPKRAPGGARGRRPLVAHCESTERVSEGPPSWGGQGAGTRRAPPSSKTRHFSAPASLPRRRSARPLHLLRGRPGASYRAAPDGALCAQARSTERCTFPKALFGSSSTKKTSRGCLYSASAP